MKTILTLKQHKKLGIILKILNTKLSEYIQGKKNYQVRNEKKIQEMNNKLRSCLEDNCMDSNKSESYHTLTQIYYGDIKQETRHIINWDEKEGHSEGDTNKSPQTSLNKPKNTNRGEL